MMMWIDDLKMLLEDLMKTKNKIGLLVLCFSLLVVGCGSNKSVDNTSNNEARVLKLGHKTSENHSWHKGSLFFKELVEERTDGNIQIDIYPNSLLGDQRTMTEAAQLGVVDIVLDSPAILTGFVPEIGVFDLPFLFKDYEHAYESLDNIGMELDPKLKEVGLKLLAYWETGFKRLSNSKIDIKSIKDLAGLKVRTPGSPILVATLESIGASPISVAWNETYIALQQGTAEAQFNPPSTMLENKINEVQDYYSDNLTIQYGAEPVIMSLKTWNELSPEYQKIVIDAANEAKDYQRKVSREDDKRALQEMIDSGVTVSKISDEILAELMELTEPVRKEYASTEFLKRISEIVR